MKQWINILIFCCLYLNIFAQEETRVVDSLLSVVAIQEGRDKVLTMIELTWEFYDVSYDDCIDWGTKAINEAHEQGFADLEAKSNYVLGMQYAFHGDLDLAKEYLQKSYDQYMAISDTENAFESLWDIATYELSLGNIDTAYQVYEKALLIAEEDYYYARACIYGNMALICKQKNQFQKAIDLYIESRRIFKQLEDERMSVRIDFELASVYYELGDVVYAKRVFKEVIPKLEKYDYYYPLFVVCKNMGVIFENDFVNYDSAYYYLNKAMEYSKMPIPDKEGQVYVNNEKSGVVVEMGNILVRLGEPEKAIEKYQEALQMAEDVSYSYGQMQAYIGLIKVYGQLGKAEKSLQYYQRYSELEKKTGITNLRLPIVKTLIMDYARVGRYDDLFAEVESLEEDYVGLVRENADIYNENRNLKNDLDGLLQQHDSQNAQIQTLQTQRNHYRLAFFGILGIVLATIVLFIAYKIVRKKRTKTK